MDNKPVFDRSIFIPIFIGFFSVLGICLVLFAARLSAARGTVQSVETETPMKYQYLATEPGIALPTDAPPATATATAVIEISTPTTLNFQTTPAVTTTAIELSTPVPTILNSQPTLTAVHIATNTPATASATPLVLNVKYDDTDFKFNYTGNWISQKNVTDTYQNTLHLSNTIGDGVQLSFAGQKILFSYQAGPSLGAVAIILDGVDFALDQSTTETRASTWESPVLTLSSHTINITHISGGSVNVDAIEVLDLSTPTPTATATP